MESNRGMILNSFDNDTNIISDIQSKDIIEARIELYFRHDNIEWEETSKTFTFAYDYIHKYCIYNNANMNVIEGKKIWGRKKVERCLLIYFSSENLEEAIFHKRLSHFILFLRDKFVRPRISVNLYKSKQQVYITNEYILK